MLCSSFAGGGRRPNSDQCLPLIAIQARSWRSLKAFSVDCAKLGEGRVRQREFGRRQILVQVGDRRDARDQKNIGCPMQLCLPKTSSAGFAVEKRIGS
jgi:hypothetical protein